MNMRYHYCYSFFSFLLLFVSLLFIPSFSYPYTSTLSSTESLTYNQTIVSPGRVFELGFFPLDPGWYLGIRYFSETSKTYVWIANRDNPLSNATGILKISDGKLVLLDQSNKVFWSTNWTGEDPRSPLVGELLDNGNFVLRETDNKKKGEDGYLGQSFDYPTNTLFPQMKLGFDPRTKTNKILKSWKGPNDPSSGNYMLELRCLGLPEFLSSLNSEGAPILYRGQPWDGTPFNGTIDQQNCFFTNSRSTISLESDGVLRVYDGFVWRTFPRDECDVYMYCPPNSYCDINKSPFCNCIKGFEANANASRAELKFECVRKTELNCPTDGFERLKSVTLPSTKGVIVDRVTSTKECRQRCLQNCNCTAFATTDTEKGGWGCSIWVGQLMDIRNESAGGHDLYVRLAASDLEPPKEEKNKMGIIWGSIAGGIIIIFIIIICLFYLCCWRRRNQTVAIQNSAPTIVHEVQELLRTQPIIPPPSTTRDSNSNDSQLPKMEFTSLVVATDNFSEANKLGQGGFGGVYKGRLCNGEEIAVKRLSNMSSQGDVEFNNEVQLIGRLQHLNLVRLLGWCIEADEKMLVYEYQENRSLDFYLFDKNQSSKLNWGIRFDIIKGIANGLRYIHEESRLKVVHRDLKASNILIDKNMTPKISDFGLARIFGREETDASTRNIAGTLGYMSPEYLMDGIYSMKSDVFSFGVLLLEIISGKMNRGFENSDGTTTTLVRHVWKKWVEGKWLEIVDPTLSAAFPPKQVQQCIQTALACVQDHADDRPLMSSATSLLTGATNFQILLKEPLGYVKNTN